jgi:hypothetical protein
MRKLLLLIFIMLSCSLLGQYAWAGNSFKFPERIKFKLLKNDKVMGSCRLDYRKKSSIDGVSSLKLKNFEGYGMTSQESLLTYISLVDSSLYSTFLLKGEKVFSELRLKEGMGFDMKKGNVFIYKESNAPSEMQTELFTKHPIIDLVSLFYVTSKRVAKGNYKKVQKYNFLFGKSTKIMDMVCLEKEQAPFQGKIVPVEVFIISYHNVEMFRLKIYKDSDDYFFPVSISVVTDFNGNHQESFELRADKVYKN